MAVSKEQINTLVLLDKSFQEEKVGLVEGTDKKTGNPVTLICRLEKFNGEQRVIPLAKMFDGDPYEELQPPKLKERK